MLRRRPSQKDLEKRMDALRASYSAFIKKYQKGHVLIGSLDERYFEALRTRMDLVRFLTVEEAALKEMEEGEAAGLRRAQDQKDELKLTERKKQNTAQRVWEEHQRRIEKYPSYGLHPEASSEVDKLLGALAAFEEGHWSALERTFRGLSHGRDMDTRVAMEMKWRDFCIPGTDGAPPRMAKYRTLLSRFPRDQKALEWEERQILYEAARFMGIMRNTLGEYLNDPKLLEVDKDKVYSGQEALEGILIDFRLADLIKLAH